MLLRSSASAETSSGESNSLKVFYSKAYLGVILCIPESAITGTLNCLAAKDIINVPGCISSPPFLKTASTPNTIIDLIYLGELYLFFTSKHMH